MIYPPSRRVYMYTAPEKPPGNEVQGHHALDEASLYAINRFPIRRGPLTIQRERMYGMSFSISRALGNLEVERLWFVAWLTSWKAKRP